MLRAATLRAQSIWLMSYVAFFAWIFFFALYWLLDLERAGSISAWECISHAFVILAFARSKNYLLIMNLLMGFNTIGIFAISCTSSSYYGVIHFTPILILVASQLFGKRQAFYWLLVCLTSMTTFYLVHKPLEFQPDFLVGITVLLGVPCCIFFCCQQAEVHYEKKTSKLVAFSQDLQSKADDLQVLATTDSLTRLPNRYHFQNELDARVRQDGQPRPFVLYLIDMDGFKEINDTMGHGVGDEVLTEIGSRLSQHCGNVASLARLGGDEFCVLFDGLSSLELANTEAAAVHDALTGSYAIRENEFSLGASVGFARYPADATCAKSLLAYADTAMYHAKHNKLATASYTPVMTERLLENRALNDRLANSLENEEFHLVYQPQFDLESKRITGVEALLRWSVDDKLIPPNHFIPLLEQSGRMIEVSRWVLDEVCRQQVEWRQSGLDIRIASNVSPLQFEDPDFVQNVMGPIGRHDVDPTKIDLEITEGLLIKDLPNVVSKLDSIREMGIQISIDDFGTGYSSLAYLRELPIDKLKIDRAFVKDIPESDDGVIASSIILLGHMLGMIVLAEGVETEEQLSYLRKHNCNEAQGYLFSRPEKPEVIFENYFALRSFDEISPPTTDVRLATPTPELN